MSESEMKTGTATTARNITAARLKQAVEYHAPVSSVNGQTGEVSISIPTVPTNVSDFTNDAGYLTSYTETDPVFSESAASEITSTDINNWNAKVSRSGDTMTGDLSFADGKGIELNYSGYKDKLYLIGYGPSTRTASFEYKTELRNIQAPTTDSAAANKEYVDNKIPKVYSSTNTNGYLTMATLPIYDGTVE